MPWVRQSAIRCHPPCFPPKTGRRSPPSRSPASLFSHPAPGPSRLDPLPFPSHPSLRSPPGANVYISCNRLASRGTRVYFATRGDGSLPRRELAVLRCWFLTCVHPFTSAAACSSLTPPHHHPESPLKKPSRTLTARIQATLNRLTSCALAASGEIVWNGEEIQASPQENERRSKYRAAMESSRMVEKQSTYFPVKCGFLSISAVCQLSQTSAQRNSSAPSTWRKQRRPTKQNVCFLILVKHSKWHVRRDELEKSRCVFSFASDLQSERCTAGSRALNAALVFLSGHPVWGRLPPGRVHLPRSGCGGEPEQSGEGARRKRERDAVRRRPGHRYAAKAQTKRHKLTATTSKVTIRKMHCILTTFKTTWFPHGPQNIHTCNNFISEVTTWTDTLPTEADVESRWPTFGHVKTSNNK